MIRPDVRNNYNNNNNNNNNSPRRQQEAHEADRPDVDQHGVPGGRRRRSLCATHRRTTIRPRPRTKHAASAAQGGQCRRLRRLRLGFYGRRQRYRFRGGVDFHRHYVISPSSRRRRRRRRLLSLKPKARRVRHDELGGAGLVKVERRRVPGHLPRFGDGASDGTGAKESARLVYLGRQRE